MSRAASNGSTVPRAETNRDPVRRGAQFRRRLSLPDRCRVRIQNVANGNQRKSGFRNPRAGGERGEALLLVG